MSIKIDPLAEDDEIADRLTKILTATTCFEKPEVKVEEGVVFLKGTSHQADYRSWAGDLARSIQDVIAVENRIQVIERSMWDLSPAWIELWKFSRDTIQMLTLIGLANVLLVTTWFSASVATAVSRAFLGRRIKNNLIVRVISRAIANPVFVLGVYPLTVFCLTQMAEVVPSCRAIGTMVPICFPLKIRKQLLNF